MKRPVAGRDFMPFDGAESPQARSPQGQISGLVSMGLFVTSLIALTAAFVLYLH